MSWGKFFKAVGKAVAAANASPPKQAPIQRARPKLFPVMTMEMIDSKGEPITKAQAVKLFKEYMLGVGYLEKDEVVEHANYFAEAMAEESDALEREAMDDLNSMKEELKSLREQRKGETDADTKDILDEQIESIKDDIKSEEQSCQPARDALAAFKKDKRQFLIDYVNHEVQGS